MPRSQLKCIVVVVALKPRTRRTGAAGLVCLSTRVLLTHTLTLFAVHTSMQCLLVGLKVAATQFGSPLPLTNRGVRDSTAQDGKCLEPVLIKCLSA